MSEALKDAVASPAAKKPLVPIYILPTVLKKGLEEAWEKSLLMGETGIRAREHGGILVRTWPAGTLAWRPVKPGRSDEIDLPAHGVHAHLLAGETLVATGHTHPGAGLRGLDSGSSFSAGDLLYLTYGDLPMMFARSVDTVSMVRKTEAFEKLVREKGWAKLKGDIEKTYDEAAVKFPGGSVASSYAGTIAVCEKFGLEFFQGEGDTLTKAAPGKYRPPPAER